MALSLMYITNKPQIAEIAELSIDEVKALDEKVIA